MILHYDQNMNYVQTVPDSTGGRGGYDKFSAIMDVMGGFMGGDFVLPLSARHQALRIKRGHYLVWAEQGRAVYGGQVTARDNQGDMYFIQMDGVVNIWAKRQPGHIAWGPGRASDAMEALVRSYGPGPLLSTRADYITRPTAYQCAAYTFTQQKVVDIINHYNNFEGYEWGGDIIGTGLNRRTVFYYHAPDTTTLHYVIDARTLAAPLQLKPDTEKYGNRVRVYYDPATGGAGYVDMLGTAEARAAGTDWAPDIDIGNVTGTTAAEAQEIGRQYLAGLKVNGLETEPVNAEIVLDDDTRIRSVSGAASYPFWLRPGCNVYLAGASAPGNRIGAAGAGTSLHITSIEWNKSERRVKLTANRSDSLPVMLARLARTA